MFFQCRVYYKHMWNLWNGNTCPLYVHMGQFMMHGWPNVTLVGHAVHDVLLSFFLPPGKHLWNSYLCNNSIGYNNSRCIWKLVVSKGATLYPLHRSADLGAKVWFLYRPRRCCSSATTESVHAANSNPWKLSFSIEVPCNMFAHILNPS